MAKVKSNVGGRRKGAGRPKIASPMVVVGVRLKPEQKAKAERVGNGNAGDGIRVLIDREK